MSESPQPVRAGGARYQRTSGGLVGAMLVTVLAVLAFAAFRAVTSETEPTPVRAVDYATTVTSARAENRLLVLAPERLPLGWKATSATYAGGTAPTWHLGTLTADGDYVGIEEARAGVEDMVEEHVDVDAERGEDVTVAGETWQSWTDAGGDYALARALDGPEGVPESVLVVGSAPADEVRDLAGSLAGARP
jgi:hypothetical protein